ERDRFALSPDGRLLAVQKGPCQVEVREPASPGPPRCLTPTGRFHHDVKAELGECWLALLVDRSVSLFRWDEGRLMTRHDGGAERRDVLGVEWRGGRVRGGVRARSGQLPPFLRDGSGRFREVAHCALVAAVDTYGQVFLFEPGGALVCAFFAFRDQ